MWWTHVCTCRHIMNIFYSPFQFSSSENILTTMNYILFRSCIPNIFLLAKLLETKVTLFKLCISFSLQFFLCGRICSIVSMYSLHIIMHFIVTFSCMHGSIWSCKLPVTAVDGSIPQVLSSVRLVHPFPFPSQCFKTRSQCVLLACLDTLSSEQPLFVAVLLSQPHSDGFRCVPPHPAPLI